jgi:hypothetical protein
MHTLASLFVTLVVTANVLFPKSNLPQVLGIETSGSSHQATGSLESNGSGSGSLRFRTLPSHSPFPSNRPKDASGSGNFFQKIVTAFENHQNGPKDGTPSGITREEFKLKLSEIKDTVKQQRLTSLDGNITKINQRAVANWNSLLDRLSLILDKIKTKTTELSGQGKDVSSVLSAISTAESKIAAAKAAVSAQSGKTYVIDIGTGNNLGQNASATIQTMKADLKAVEALVRDALQSVKDVYFALRGVIGTGTPHPSPTP